MDRILQYLADYALGLSYGDLPEEVVDRVKHLLADTLGCALGTAPRRPRRVGPSQLADNKFEYCGYEPNLGLRMAILISKPHG